MITYPVGKAIEKQATGGNETGNILTKRDLTIFNKTTYSFTFSLNPLMEIYLENTTPTMQKHVCTKLFFAIVCKQ